MDFKYNMLVDCIAGERNAWEYCIQKLFPLMNYKVLTIEDVRPVDLKEWLSRISNKIPYKAKELYPGTDDFYMFMLKLYLDEKISCRKGTRAEKYKKRAYELINEAKTNTSLYCTFDALMIMLSLFRPIKDKLDIYNERVILNPTITVQLEDADLLYSIYNNKKLFPGNVIEKKGRWKKISLTESETKDVVTFFYVNSIILLTRMLQDRGAFCKQEES